MIKLSLTPMMFDLAKLRSDQITHQAKKELTLVLTENQCHELIRAFAVHCKVSTTWQNTDPQQTSARAAIRRIRTALKLAGHLETPIR